VRFVTLAMWCLCLVLVAGCVSEQARIEQMTQARAAAVAAWDLSTLDNFDAALSWRVDAGESDPAKLALSKPVKDSKDRAMVVTFKLGEKKKVVLGHRMTPRDLSKHAALVLDVNNQLAETCDLSLALLTLPGWQYAESPKLALSPGTNANLIFELDKAHFKTTESKWQYSQGLPNPKAVAKLVLILHPTSGGTVEFDNLRLAKPNVPAAAAAVEKSATP